ncbi:MAG: hypothetical protein J0L97_03495 [Alphaproteobacteria bacterium]|nr:hypothetical protein [Alphaproteobacteria bacterium]
MATLHEQAVQAFYTALKDYSDRRFDYAGHQIGHLSTTFTLDVFAAPHLPGELNIFGFHTALRPTDADEGSHLVSFGQAYIATNRPLSDPQGFTRDILRQVLTAIRPGLDTVIEDMEIASLGYSWKAESTVYEGTGTEENVLRIKVAGQWLAVGRMEMAQFNEFADAGGVHGATCHLIVFGIDRLLLLARLAEILEKPHGIQAMAEADFAALYPYPPYEASVLRGIIDGVTAFPEQPKAWVDAIEARFVDLRDRVFTHQDFSRETFTALGDVSRLFELVYASGAITRNLRKHYIREARELYEAFGQAIHANPQAFEALIRQEITPNAELPASYQDAPPGYWSLVENAPQYGMTIQARTGEKPLNHAVSGHAELKDWFLRDHLYGLLDRTQKAWLGRNDLMMLNAAQLESAPADMAALVEAHLWFRERDILNIPEAALATAPEAVQALAPTLVMKYRQYVRVVGDDLARDVVALAQSPKAIADISGYLPEQLELHAGLAEWAMAEFPIKLSGVNMAALKTKMGFIGVEAHMLSPKLHPELEGKLGAIAIASAAQVDARIPPDAADFVWAYRNAGKGHLNQHDLDASTLLAIAVGHLDEALGTYARLGYPALGSNDPFGIKGKLTLSFEAAAALGLERKEIQDLVQEAIARNTFICVEKQPAAWDLAARRLDNILFEKQF